MQIFVSGSLAYDRIMDFPGKFSDHILPDKIHILNVCFTVNGLKERFGGTAGNIAYSLGLLGESPIIVASAGKDFDRYETWLGENNLSIEGILKIGSEFTAGAYITTDLSDNQITGFNPGAMKYPSNFNFESKTEKDVLAIIAPGCLEDMVAYSKKFKELKVPYIFDPGQSIPALTGQEITDMLTGAHMLISNDYELELIMNATGLSKGELLERTPLIITTLAEKGSLIRNPINETFIPAIKVDPVLDPTGAGDAYRAGLIKGLVMGKDLVKAAQMGAICASYGISHQGTQEHRFDVEAFKERYRKAFNEDI
jgi:adenosine kinase